MAAPQLAAGEIHLWWIDLDDSAADPAALSAAERARAARLQLIHDQRRHVAAHAARRAILARYVGVAAAALEFVADAAGKPALDADKHGRRAPVFNLSHSDRHAALAIAREGRIGVDLELARPDPQRALLLELLAPGERAAAGALDDAAFSSAFHVAWTRKEACLKALGSGFSVHPSRVDAGIESGPRVVMLAADDAPAAADSQLPVHVVTLWSRAAVPTSLARVGTPIGALRRFHLPALPGSGFHGEIR